MSNMPEPSGSAADCTTDAMKPTARSRPSAASKPWRGPLQLAALVFAIMLTGCASQESVPRPTIDIELASPMSGPGRADLDRKETESLQQAWQALAAGQFERARTLAAALPASPQADLIRLQIDHLDDATTTPLTGFRDLTNREPGYASAWVSYSFAAEHLEEEAEALMAARRAAALWPRSKWEQRAEHLENRWITDRTRDAASALKLEEPARAVELASKVLALVPEQREALLILGRAERQRGDLEAAEAALMGLGNDPEALLERAGMASEAGLPSQAMDLLSRLPDEHPARDTALRRARLEWRLSVMPPVVQESVASESLTRAQLAVLVISLAPKLETLDGEPPPLMPDIVDHPAQRQVLTAVRLGLVEPDPLDGLFYPDRPASPDLVRAVVTSACHMAGYAPPLWCEAGAMVESGCHSLTTPVSGASIVSLVLDRAGASQ